MGLYKSERIFTIVAAALFLVGAVFMLINIFAAQEWAFGVGLVLAITSAVLYILIQIQHIRFKRKYTANESELKALAEESPKKA
jgi:membrane protein YdbS with pleckstrin-like domain